MPGPKTHDNQIEGTLPSFMEVEYEFLGSIEGDVHNITKAAIISYVGSSNATPEELAPTEKYAVQQSASFHNKAVVLDVYEIDPTNGVYRSISYVASVSIRKSELPHCKAFASVFINTGLNKFNALN